MDFDFSAILLGLTVVFGVVWALDRLFFYKARMTKAVAAGQEVREPVAVDWARSLFPVMLAVLLLRSFVAEPFRIPSGSMMPTLDVGDFILVNKFTYGLRMPAFNNKLVGLGEPKRGDVVVFRFPGYICTDGGKQVRSGDQSCADPHAPVPSQNWIKRIIGLPGDRVEMHGDQLLINGEPVNADEVGPYVGNPKRDESRLMLEMGATVWNEHLGAVNHLTARMPAYTTPPPIPNQRVPSEVPAGCYLVMGDNRYNSTDSRWWGCMPEENLAGKAFLIWLSLNGSGVAFDRMGRIIH
ncbi:signal peptidase I [Dyella tabacisoli]|uniref:Signal peptidase I n=1 Tax=Dyella tabacisoli TaxID=2282381 RepID=A0A369USJ0_9GAMM|nr:signal peptidase I [Dyella tabacisoli]RDD83283.1 signal peptidase I [Dyella tabacisoli]